MRNLIFFLILSLFTLPTFCQQAVTGPSFIAKSHETLEVMRVLQEKNELRIDLIVRNRLESGGSFCVSPSTTIRAGNRHIKINRKEGIPWCPESYNFQYFGESLRFSLFFKDTGSSIRVIDLEENCDENCFWILGIVTDPKINEKLLLAYDHYETGFLEQAYPAYQEIYNELDDSLDNIKQLCAFYLAKISHEEDNKPNYLHWKAILENSQSRESGILLYELTKNPGIN